MNRTIEVNCPQCGKKHTFVESELQSGMSIKDAEGRIIQEHPPVEVDENTFIQCEECGYPVRCNDAIISD